MADARFFAVDMPAGALLPLSPEDVHHAASALRMTPGELVTLVLPDGSAEVRRLTHVSRDGLAGDVVEAIARPWLPRVTLVTALGKGDKTDVVVEKSVEIGVERIVLLSTERTIVRLDAAKAARRLERLARVARAAAAQSQRFEIPPVTGPISVDVLAGRLADWDRVLVAWEEAPATGIDTALAGLPRNARVAVVVGPEGGLAPSEVATLEGFGARAVTLGPTILRTETAGVVATALVAAAMGGLGIQGLG